MAHGKRRPALALVACLHNWLQAARKTRDQNSYSHAVLCAQLRMDANPSM